jgi:hypothetical protein
MTRKTVLAALVLTTVVGGLSSSALASDDTPRRICLMATDDPQNQGKEPICVWLPGVGELPQ